MSDPNMTIRQWLAPESCQIVVTPPPPCEGCGGPAVGQLRLLKHPEVWCVDCVRKALLRLRDELKTKEIP